MIKLLIISIFMVSCSGGLEYDYNAKNAQYRECQAHSLISYAFCDKEWELCIDRLHRRSSIRLQVFKCQSQHIACFEEVSYYKQKCYK